jgi:16S rRNA pseudouridine516 synthase
MAQFRLDKLLADRTQFSRADIKKIIRSGAVTVDGTKVTDGGFKVDPDTQTVTCMGKQIRGGAHLYLVMNKPVGVISATEDRKQKTVIDLVPKEFRVKGLFPAGRLDADSTGLLLLTDDGELAHRMLSPKHHVPKCYLVRLARPYEDSYAERFAQGLTLSDGMQCLPAEICSLREHENYALVRVQEGKYHQVKRMLAAVGNHVEHLHRIAVGSYLLPPQLPPGACLEVFHRHYHSR